MEVILILIAIPISILILCWLIWIVNQIISEETARHKSLSKDSMVETDVQELDHDQSSTTIIRSKEVYDQKVAEAEFDVVECE